MKDKNEKQTNPEVQKVEMEESLVKKIRESYLDVYYYQLKQENGLLGEYDVDGKYTIKDAKILDSLVTIPKQFQEKTDNLVRAAVKIGRNVLNFVVELDLAESYCSAELSLVEIEHGAEEDVKHVQELGQIVEMYSPLFVENVYKQWNIRREPVEIDKEDPIFKLLDASDKMFDFLLELTELLAQVCLIRMLQTLEKCGPVGKKILAEYNEYLKKYGKAPGSSDYHTKLKKKLDELIIKNNALDLVIKNGGDIALKGVINPINAIRGIETPTAVETKNTQPTNEKQVVATPAPKPAAKAKSGNKSAKNKGGSNDKGSGSKKGDKKDKGPLGGSGKKIPDPVPVPILKGNTNDTLGMTGSVKSDISTKTGHSKTDDVKNARAALEGSDDNNFSTEMIYESEEKTTEVNPVEKPIVGSTKVVEVEKVY